MVRFAPVPRLARVLLLLLLALLSWVRPLTVAAQVQLWDDPRPLSTSGGRFVQAASSAGMAVIVWQEFVPSPGGIGGRLYLSLTATRDFRTYVRSDRFFGPIPYSEKEVPVFSLAVTSKGIIYCAVLTGPSSVAVLASRDGGKSFRAAKEQTTPATTVAPTISVTSSDALLLFVTQTLESGAEVDEAAADSETAVIRTQPITLALSRSENGQSWSPFVPFVSEAHVGTNLKPSHTSWGGREYVVFQALDNTFEQGFYHLFLKTSDDGGKSWGDALPIRFRESYLGALLGEERYDNQRPMVQALPDRIAVAWERGYEVSGSRQIYYTELDRDGAPLDFGLRPVSTGGYRSSNPEIVVFRGKPWLLWFNNREEGRIILAERGDLRWNEVDLTRDVRGANIFGRPLVFGDQLYVAWDNARGDTTSVQLLEPDRRALAPDLRPVDFVAGRRDSRSRVRVSWTAPRDPSGIVGYAYSWGRDPKARAEDFAVSAATTTATVSADEDGLWYFHVRARDGAGNWSGASSLAFFRDTTPPLPVAIEAPETDGKGFLVSNTFRIAWSPAEAEDVARYTYRLEFVGPESMPAGATVAAPALPGAMTSRTEVGGTNADNGTYAFAVSAVDTAGNVGEAATLVFRLNKYVPVTYISNVAATVDRLGATTLTLFGRGFEQGGLVSRLFLDRDGVAPYDYEFDLESGIYTVVNDRLVDGVKLPEIEPGSYRIGVEHPSRGIAFAPNRLGFVDRGTVKLGNYTYSFLPSWELRPGRRTFVSANAFLVWLVVGFLGILLVVSTRRLAALAAEGRMLREEVAAIIEGRGSSVQKKQAKLAVAQRRGMGLRLKFTLLMMLLVMIIVLIISVPLSFTMIQTQRKTLLDTLFSRVQVLTGSIAVGAEQPLKDTQGGGELQLSSDLPNQVDQMSEATYLLITGSGRAADEQDDVDYLWGYKLEGEGSVASFLEAGAVPENYGRNRLIEDDVQRLARELAIQTTGKARTELTGFREEIAQLQKDARSYIGKTDTPSVQELEKIDKARGEKEREIARRLIAYKAEIVSAPDFANADKKLEATYEFVKPIVYTLPDDDRYVRGMVRLGVSTATIERAIQDSLVSLIRQTSIIALGALGLGILGAIILASMTVAPIKRLARGVAVIRDTQDKEQLGEHRIDVRTRDEIGTLAQTINEMTQGLVSAATASKDLVVGQETQKMFISLDLGPDGKKGSVGGAETDKVEIFGFYEGARTVSGDYFEFVKLDDKHYAFIKCDVAGKGVPAALVMVEVATLFSSFTRKWPQSQEKFRLDRFVYEVNDMLEVRGFKGRFAAFVVCILNVETGVSYLCHAGDNILHYFDGAERKMKNLTLPSSPASGVFPSSLVELQNGYQQVKHLLRPGDIFAFHTDGVEEDHRYFRDAAGNPRLYDEPDVEEERRHGFAPPKKGEASEMIETERLFGVIDACLNRSTYVLTKFYNPNPGEEFTFDFRSGTGSLREAVLAVMGLDKMFRIYRDSTTDENARIKVDRNIVEILRKHYVQFGDYFSHPVDDDGKSLQITFSHLREDDQFDDLTMLMVRKK